MWLGCITDEISVDFVEGEFHVDLYTLPDNLIQMLWTFTKEKGMQVGA